MGGRSALAPVDLKVNFARGDRVLRRDQPLLPPLIVDHVRTWYAGEPETNGPVWCVEQDARRASRGCSYEQCELVHCPPGYEPAPSSQEPRHALIWLLRNWRRVVALHGSETAELTLGYIHDRLRMRERIDNALAAEPGATAMRRAEIALECGR